MNDLNDAVANWMITAGVIVVVVILAFAGIGLFTVVAWLRG